MQIQRNGILFVLLTLFTSGQSQDPYLWLSIQIEDEALSKSQFSYMFFLTSTRREFEAIIANEEKHPSLTMKVQII